MTARATQSRPPSRTRSFLWATAGPALGALSALFAFPTFNVWPLVFLALFFPVLGVKNSAPGTAFLAGLLFGMLLFLFGFTWVEHTLRVFAYMPRWMAWSGLFLLSLYHGLAQALWLLAVVLLKRRASVPYWAAVPLTYVPIEHFFPALFPWQLGTPLLIPAAVVQVAELTGACGVTFLVAMVSGALVDWVEGVQQQQKGWAHRRGLLFGGSLLLLLTGYGAIRLAQVDKLCRKARKSGGVLTVGTVQPNIGIYEKESKDKSEDHVDVLKRLSRGAVARGAELVVWPETAIQVPADHKTAMAEVARGGLAEPKNPALPAAAALDRVWLIAGGFVDHDRPGGTRISYNAGFLIRPGGGVTGVALKNHLLMFGEYLPFEDRFPSLRKRFPHAGDLKPGKRPSVFRWNAARLGMAICYEDLIPEFVRTLAREGAHVIINITNDSWFGRSREPAQHLALAALRSVETRKAMVRSTNTGISAVIDPAGRVVARTAIFERAVLVRPVELLSGKTPYVRAGPVLVYLCLFALGATLLQTVFSGRRHRQDPKR